MDERKTNRPKKREAQPKQDYVIFVTLIQVFCCLFVFLLLFALSRGNSSRAQELRQDYALLFSRSWEMQTIGEAVGAVRDFFLPQDGAKAVLVQPKSEAAVESDPPEKQETLPETTEAPAETEAPVSAKPLRKAAAAEQPQAKDLAAGSGDAASDQEQAVSFSPSAVTVPITRPVEGGRYSSYFGYRTNPITHQYAFHTGLDIAVPQGTMIRAAYGGTVRLTGEDSRSGKYVTITHDDGYETFYCHCSKILIARGTVVRAGEAVACVGSTGWATGPHLHFEIRKNGARLDPLQILEHDV